jgi:hypothetical protein
VVVWFEAAVSLSEDEDWEFVQLFILLGVIEGSGSIASGSKDEERQPGQ